RGLGDPALQFEELLHPVRRHTMHDDRGGPRAAKLHGGARRMGGRGVHAFLHFSGGDGGGPCAQGVSEPYCRSARREKIRSALRGRLWKRMPVASASALPRAALTGMTGASPIGFAPKGP